jgi:putative ABC transport system substrate-binding protein
VEKMRRPRGLLRTAALCVVVVTELVPAFSEGPATVAVVMSRDIAPYREALKGFEARLRTSGRPFRIVEINMEASARDPEALLERIRARRPALVLTLGSAATSVVAEGIRDIPVVFSLVLPSTGRSSLEELRASHGNITGASMEIPIATQFAKLREVLPSARRVGVLFDPAISGPMVELAGKVAADMGLDLVPLAVGSEKDVVRRMEEAAGSIDVLWSVADSTVFTPQGLRHILLSTLRSRLPFVGLSPAFVKAGALLALSCDYQDVGRQSGDLAARILAGEVPGRIPTVVPREVSLSVNMNTARQIDVAISDEVQRSAELVF